MSKELEELRRRVASELVIAIVTKLPSPSAQAFVDQHGPMSVVEFSVLVATDLVQRLESTATWAMIPNPYGYKPPRTEGG